MQIIITMTTIDQLNFSFEKSNILLSSEGICSYQQVKNDISS
jgi:hypothetical protein